MQDEDVIVNEPKAGKPDLEELSRLFYETHNDLSGFFERCDKNAQTRLCKWEGQSDDQRKYAANLGGKVFPYNGASDVRTYLSEMYLRYVHTACMASIRRMRATAYPASSDGYDIKRANRASEFARWLISIIPEYYREVDHFVNQLLEAGVGMLKPYWHKQLTKFVSKIGIADIPSEYLQVVLTPEQEDLAVKLLVQLAPEYEINIKDEKRARKIIQKLREEGQAEVQKISGVVDRPCVRSLSPRHDVIFPANTTDYQLAPFYFEICHYSVKDLRSFVANNGWAKDWVDYAEENLVGKGPSLAANEAESRSDLELINDDRLKNSVFVVHFFQKIADEDGVIGVYETIFSPVYTEKHAKHGLIEHEIGMYPIVVQKLEEQSRLLYESRGLVELLAGYQFNYKLEVDMNNDRNSLATNPPIKRLINGLEPVQNVMAPGNQVLVRRENEYSLFPVAPFNPGSIEARNEILQMADTLVGRPNNNMTPGEAQTRLQYFIDKVLEANGKLTNIIYVLAKQYGPEETWYRVLGTTEAAVFKKDNRDNFSFVFSADQSGQDIEILKKKMEMIISLGQMDGGKTIPPSLIIKEGANLIDPSFAERLVVGEQDGVAKSISEEDTAIAKVTAGIMLDIDPIDQKNAIKAQRYMEWMQSPAAQALLKSPEVAPAIVHRAEQWQQAYTQNQVNTEIGKFGNMPSGVSA